MSATSGGGGSVSEGSEAGGSSQSTMSASDSPSTSFQNNLENVTKITLSEENSAEVTGSKINLSLDERQQKDGIVNVAFDYEDETNRSGDFKSINGSEKKDKVPEAVNLELVNMVPYSNGNGTSYGVPVNGIPMKKDSEQVDMSSPYDEYFVPVNEHKKYMRGEKLYVTKDKRRPASWRRCLSWIVACTVISVVLIVAILAGTGTILSQEQNYIKEASIGRNFAGSNLKPSVTDKSPSPTAEMYMYVPRSIESEFVIDNLDFDPALMDTNSSAYHQFASNMEDQLKMLLFDKETLEFGASDVGLRIVNISRDPFKVNYRIGWNYKQDVNNPPEPIKMEDVKKRLVESLARNQGYIDKYHIDREAIKVNQVINSCQMDNGGCSHICYYNYITQEFTCTCPTHLVLDNGGKNCVAWTGSSEDDAVPVPSHAAYPGMPYESTANPAHEYESGVHYEHGTHHFHNHPEGNSESSYESESTGHGDEERKDYEPVAEPEPEPEPTPEPGSSVETNSDHQHIHSSHDIEGHDRASEPTDELSKEHRHHSHAGHSVYESKEPTPEPGSASDSESEERDHHHGVHLVDGYKDHEPSAEPTPEPGSGSEGDDSDHVVHSGHGYKEHEPSAEPAPEPTASSEKEDHDYIVHSGHDHKDHEPSAEPTPEPSSDSKSGDQVHSDHSLYGYNEHEPSAEPTPEPVPEPSPESGPEGRGHTKDDHSDHSVHSIHGLNDHEHEVEPTAEPAPEPTAEPSAEGNVHDHSYHSGYDSKNHEPEAEPTPEPAPEPSPDNESEQKQSGTIDVKDHEPSAEPTPEPAPEPTAEENDDKKAHDHSSVYESKDHEPSAEPTPEPVSEHSVNSDSEDKIHSHIDQSVYKTKDNEPSAEPTPEPAPEPAVEPTAEPVANSNTKEEVHDSVHHTMLGPGNNEGTTEKSLKPGSESSSSDRSTYSVYELENQENTPEAKQNSESKQESGLTPTEEHKSNEGISEVKTQANTEPAPEPTPEPVPGSDFTDSKSTTHSQPHENDSTDNLSPQTSTSQHNSDHGIGDQNESKVEKQSEHVPYLKDILIANTSPNSGGQNDTGHSHNPLENVERTASGEPVIEEIIIDKPNRNSEGQTEINPSHTVMPGNMRNDSDPNTTNIKSSNGHVVPQMGHSGESSTTGSILITEHHNQGVEGVTEQPKNDYSTEGIVKLENEQTSKDLTVNEDNQDSSQPTSTGHDMSVKSDAGKTMYQFHDNLSVTTMQSDLQHESHTIPVIVQLDQNSKLNTEEEIKKDNQPDMHDSRVNAGPHETEHYVTIDSTDPHEGLQNKNHETTESQNFMTTPPSILTQRGVENVNGQSTDNESTAQIENKVNQTEGNETKSPEELSNNIKDELLENEEFNTLIDKEYNNKEIPSSEGKDTTNKYPTKPLKTEKKKIKDYIKGEKIDPEKKSEITVRPGAIPEDFILQKHVNGNENTFDLDYSLQNEHTTKHDGGVTVIDPHGIEGVPGVSFKPHGINNHDISVLQTVAPDFKTETVFPTGGHELETLKPDFKNKQQDSESKLDKEYKLDKDYKYEKQKVSKKKELKKKVGGKDGKNVELEEGRKYFTKDEWDVSQEVKDVLETTMNPLEKTSGQSEIRIVSGLPGEMTTIPDSYKVKYSSSDTTFKPGFGTQVFEIKTDETTEQPGFIPVREHVDIEKPVVPTTEQNVNLQGSDNKAVDQNGHLMIDEPSVKSTFDVSTDTVSDGHITTTTGSSDSGFMNSTSFAIEHGNATPPGTVYDGIPQESSGTDSRFDSSQGRIGQNTTFVIYENTPFSTGNVNSTTADPTITIHGQSGNLQNGHIVRFANSTLHGPNATVISIFNGTLSHPDGHSFSFTNYTATFPNGSAVQPTIVVRGQSGALQGGHEIKFGNSTFHTFVTSTPQQGNGEAIKNSNVYRIENVTLPGTVFDGHFNPKDGHYHMFTNASGTFVYSNSSNPPAFIIAGQSGDFGNATAYILGNNTKEFSQSFTIPHSVIFRNSTVFAVETQDNSAQPREVVSNETIHFTHQMSPSFVSSGTAYKVNDYFGYISKCAAGQFQCLNGTSKRGSACISLSSKCDSINDCSDGSDEMGCIENGCPGNFQCSDNTCLKRNLVCNGILDCSDGSDEKNCENWKCEFDEFQCPSGRCIPVVWQCDSKPDCDNHTDEYNCQTSCGNDEYLCPEGWCIPLTYKCNGIKECSNGEDEQLCDCSHEEFKCQTGGCVSMNQVCNGLDDCPDRSDEWDCVKLDPESNILKIRSPQGDYEPVCADNWSPKYSDEVCASLGYFSSVPIENENNSITTETSFYVLKNDTTADFNRKIIVNLQKSEGNCSSGKLVEISCQEFSCGSRSMTDSSSVEARLVGGMSATAGQWPSVALIYNIRNFHSCTANVLTPRWALASYNCLKMGNKNLNEQDWKFFGGSTVFEAEKENAETRKILSIIPHPQVKFNQFLFSNDLALVELEQSIQFTSNLGAVCLPEQEIQPRQICVTAGWGMNTPEDKTIRQQLQYLPVPTMNLTECNSTEHYSGFITEDKICAGYNSAQKSLCYNEEGAPLMCVNDRGEWELQGVLSYHSNCGRGSHPSIFSSITPVKDWIKKTIRNNFERKTIPVTKR